jgi:hypothetical protein
MLIKSSLLAVALVALAAPAAAQTPVAAPAMSPAEGLQLFAAAGFRIDRGTALNVCGKPSTPKIGYVDLNGDGRPEAVAIDRNPACYGPPGDWFTIVMKERNGQWRAIMRDTGVPAWETSRSGGWVDVRRSGGGRCDRIARFNGRDYIQSSDCVAAAAPASVRTAAAAPAAANAISAAEREAIFRAAGFKPKGRDWVGCDGNTTASIEKNDVRDLNGDGALEAIVSESGSACYGNTGQGFHLLSKGRDGRWQPLFSSPGIPEFLNTSANGWPEVEIGGPGFCFPILRWNGKTYVFNRNHEYQRGACRQRQ